jgi:hypothetical protein
VFVDETAGLIPSRAARARLKGDDEDLEGVAIHWLEAGEPSRAAAALIHAGRAQLRRAHVDIVTTTILPADRRERFELLTLLARAAVIADGRDALARTLGLIVRTEALAAELGGDPALLAHCAKSRVMRFFFARRYAEAAEITEGAVAFARRAGLRDEESTNLHNVGDTYLRLGEVDRARSALVESSALADEIGDEHLRMHNEVLLAYLDAKPARIEELVEALEAEGDFWHALHTRYWLGRLLADDRDTRAPRELVRVRETALELKVHLVADECERALAELSEIDLSR